MRDVRAGVVSIASAALLGIGCAGDAALTGEQALGSEADGPNGYLIRNASLVLTMDPSVGDGMLGQLEDADVLIVGDRIAAVGHDLDPGGTGMRVIDGEGMIVMPGFIDTHDHLWQSVIRGCAADDDLIGWLNRCVFPLSGHPFSEEDAYAAVRLSTTGLINTGVTTAVDWSHSFNPGFVRGNLRALNDSGMRYHFAMWGASPDGSDIKAAKAEFIDPNPLGALQVAAHPAPGFLAAHTAWMTDVAAELGVKLHVHLLENIAQRDEDPIAVLRDAGAFELGKNLHTAHTIHLTDDEIELLAEVGASASHQPLSNMRLASGIMRLPELQAAGVELGMGLDGGTNDTPDTFNNMRAAVGLQRAKTYDPAGSPTVPEVLRMATLGGAEQLDIADQVGSLTPGKQADLIVIDPHRLNFAPRMHWVNQIVFNGQPDNVTWVFVAGRALKARGAVVGVNQDKLLSDAQVAADNIRPALAP